MQHKGLIDVVIPLYNGEKLVGETIESLLNQTEPINQIIVVDDASTDKSIEVAQKFPKVKLFKKSNKEGLGSASRNLGVKQSQTEFIAFLDQDDVCHPDHYRLLKKVLVEHHDVDATASYYKTFFDNNEPQFDMRDLSLTSINMWDIFPFSDFAEPSMLLFRRSVFDTIQWYEKNAALADHVMWMELTIHKPVIRVKAQSIARRSHPESHYQIIIKSPMDHMKQWLDVTDFLQTYYLNHFSGDINREWLERRVGLVYILQDITESLSYSKIPLLKVRAMDLEHLLKKEEEFFVSRTMEEIWDIIKRVTDAQKKKILTDYYDFLYANWPRLCTFTGEMIVDKIIEMRPGKNFYLQHVFLRPFRWKCWMLLYKAFFKKCAK